jgi:hypothetical protein
MKLVNNVDIVGKLMNIDESPSHYIKSQFEINHLKILYPALYVNENDNLFFMSSK